MLKTPEKLPEVPMAADWVSPSSVIETLPGGTVEPARMVPERVTVEVP